MNYVEGEFNSAVHAYKQAKEYGFTNPLLQLRLDTALENPQRLNEKISVKKILYWSLGSLIIVVVLVYFAIKKNFHRKLLS